MPRETWERLESHLDEVADMAGEFAEAFGMRAHGHLAGKWHDLGKYSSEFQEMIRATADATLETRRGRVDHSTFGAQHASRTLGQLGWMLAYSIAGHHGGLTDAISANSGRTPLEKRLHRSVPKVPADKQPCAHPTEQLLAPPEADIDLLKQELGSRSFDPKSAPHRAFQLAFLTRMVFSTLVDADSLCTERFYRADCARTRRPSEIPFWELSSRLREFVQALPSNDTLVNRSRAQVLKACLDNAGGPKGIFSLTVPTGGGKTFSSLGFALEHASEHEHRRVILAIPFTSIIEQNADTIRKVLERSKERIVLEHHSNLSPECETPWSSMAAENWDAPIVVTTNVQFFDSLFASARGRCRKLHRIAGSVIVLDEIQSLPVQVLEPCLAALRELVLNYGCSVVLCTATQPAIEHRKDFPIGLEGVREIVADVPALFSALKRTRIQRIGQRTNEQLVDALVDEHQALCIVNTRRHAADIFAALREQRSEGIFHLSALMCPEHRSEVLAQVIAALKEARPCVLVSTQVVEAGVDVDFPIVFRAMAGIDSIAQAAGRCNREGKLELGRVLVFETEETGSHSIKSAAEDARSVFPEHKADPLSPEAVEAYFALHYWRHTEEWDHHRVMDCFAPDARRHPFIADFRSASSRFRMIEDTQTPIIIPHGKGRQLIDELCNCERPDRSLFRRLQRYTVNVYAHQLRIMQENQLVTEPHEGIFTLMNSDAYDPELGLHTERHSGFDTMIS